MVLWLLLFDVFVWTARILHNTRCYISMFAANKGKFFKKEEAALRKAKGLLNHKHSLLTNNKDRLDNIPYSWTFDQFFD